MTLPFKIGSNLYRVNNSCTKFLKYRVDAVLINEKGILIKLKYVDEFGDFAYHKIKPEEVGPVYITKKYKKMYLDKIIKHRKSYREIKDIITKYDNIMKMKMDAKDRGEYITIVGGEE